MRRTCGACSDTQETIRGISNDARRENRASSERIITNNQCLAYNCAANVHEKGLVAGRVLRRPPQRHGERHRRIDTFPYQCEIVDGKSRFTTLRPGALET